MVLVLCGFGMLFVGWDGLVNWFVVVVVICVDVDMVVEISIVDDIDVEFGWIIVIFVLYDLINGGYVGYYGIGYGVMLVMVF